MSGNRCKALRQEFFEQHGRYPARHHVWGERNVIKKMKNGDPVKVTERYVAGPSEWRQVKRAYVRGGR